MVITDRNDLDKPVEQIQFTRCAKFLRQQAVQAESRQNLKELLGGREANGIIFTTMQKFSDGDEPLCDRSNVIVMVDEAHRGQYTGSRKPSMRMAKVSIGAAVWFARLCRMLLISVLLALLSRRMTVIPARFW